MCPAEIFVVKEKFFSAKVSVKTRQLLLAANRQAVKKPNFNIYLQKNNAKISLEFASACLPESIFQTAIFC
jgi:hypothetical protein